MRIIIIYTVAISNLHRIMQFMLILHIIGDKGFCHYNCESYSMIAWPMNYLLLNYHCTIGVTSVCLDAIHSIALGSSKRKAEVYNSDQTEPKNCKEYRH